MIKINLLPAYINQRKRLKVAIAVVTLLVIAEVAGALVYRNIPVQENADLTTQGQQLEQQLTSLQGVGTKANAVNALEAALAPKFTFVDSLEKFNVRTPDIYANTADYTYREAMLLSMTANGPAMSMSAYITEPVHIARLMLGLSRNPEFRGLPTITGNPPYDPERERQRNQAFDPNAPSNIIGGAGMMPGGMTGPGMMPPMMQGGGGAGMMPPMMGGGAGMMPPMMRGGGAGMMPGMMGGGAGGGRGDINVLPIAGSRRLPKGFTVSVAAQLAYPASRPEIGSSSQQIGGGGGGGRGGMMGGAMGAPPGMMGGAMGAPPGMTGRMGVAY